MNRRSMANLLTFMTVTERKSFRSAALSLGVTPSALSHSLRQLEDDLGVRLLNRTTRSLSETDAGRRLHDEIRPAFDLIEDALKNLSQERMHPIGKLRIYAANQLAASTVIVPIWEKYLSTYPEVDLELHVGDAVIDLVGLGYDAGIGPMNRAHSDMVVTRVTPPLKMVIVASPRYLAKHSTPLKPEDLSSHNCIQYKIPIGSSHLWPLMRDGKVHNYAVEGNLQVNESELATQAAIDGIGIAFTTDSIAAPALRDGRLVELLPSWASHFEGFSIYRPSRRRTPTSLIALIEMIRAKQKSESKAIE